MAGRTPRIDMKEWLTEDKLLQIEECASNKMTDKAIATEIIGISETTFKVWKRREPAFITALKKGRKPVGIKIQKSLYDMCEVQEYKETVEEITMDRDGNVISKHKRITTRETAPNVTAIIFALKNLMPEKWREKQEVKLGTMNEKELPKLYQALTNTEDSTNDIREAEPETSKNI